MPPCHITSQLMEMGFARSKAETALKKLSMCLTGSMRVFKEPLHLITSVYVII